MNSGTRNKRIAMLIVLATLASSAILLAQGSSELVASMLLPFDPSAIAPAAPESVQAARRTQIDVTDILRRNIFDVSTGDLSRVDAVPDAVDAVGDGEEIEIDPNAPPPNCDGSMRLVGAFVRMRREEDSFAAITDSTGESMLYQRGMQVDNREVVDIQRNRVILQPSDGRLCSLTMFNDQPRVATAATPRPRPARVSKAAKRANGGLDAAELEAGISQVNEREYNIDRALVDRLLSNQAALMRTARVIPHEEEGRVVGVKLYGIRRSSLLGRLGIQNGDMLRTINGFDMSAPDSALEAYARLRSADRITLNFVRRGQPMTVDYSIR